MTDFLATSFTGAYVEAVKPAMEFRTLFVDRFIEATNNQRQTAYAIVNPSTSQTANVRLTAFLSSPRDQTCEATLTIPPTHRVSKFFEEIFASCPAVSSLRVITFRPVGPLFITSNIPIAVGGLDVILPELKLTSLPVEIVNTGP
jgi:hypothetical protein